MALILRQSTAVDVLIGPFVDSTDGVTAETALTISQADVLLSKNGQSLTQKSDDTAAAHDSSGYYNCELDATDTNTVGTLVLVVSESGALPVRHEFQVIEEAAYDALYAAAAVGPLLATDTGDGFSAIPWNSAWDAEVQSECADALTAYDPPTNAEMVARTLESANYATAANQTTMDGKLDTIDGNVDAILVDTGTTLPGTLATIDGNVDAILVDTGTTLEGHLTDIKGATFSSSTDSLEAIRDRGDAAWTTGSGGSAPTAEAIRQEIDNNSTQLAAIVEDTGTTLPSTLSTIAGYLDTEIAAILEDTGTTIPGLIAALNDLSAADIRTAIGLASANLDTQIGALPTAAENRAEMDSNSTQLAAIVADTNELQTDDVPGLIAALDTLIDAIKAKTDSLTFTNTGVVDANITHVISDPVVSGSSKTTNWGGTE